MSRKIASNTLSAVQNFDSLPDAAQINFGAVQTMFGRSRPTIYRWVAAGIIPKPAKVSTGSVCWNVGEVRRALANLAGSATA